MEKEERQRRRRKGKNTERERVAEPAREEGKGKKNELLAQNSCRRRCCSAVPISFQEHRAILTCIPAIVWIRRRPELDCQRAEVPFVFRHKKSRASK